MARIEITSELSPAECVERLSEIVRPEWFLMPASNWEPRYESCPLVGHVGSKRIRVRKKMWGHNSFQSSLSARIEPDGRGCRIVGSIGAHPLLWAFMGVVTFMLIGSALFQLKGGALNEEGLLSLGVWLAGAWVIFGLGRLAAWDEAGFLEKIAVDAIQGRRSDRMRS